MYDLGSVSYSQALELQQHLHAEVAAGDRPDTLILLEHPHVYTLGRRGIDGRHPGIRRPI